MSEYKGIFKSKIIPDEVALPSHWNDEEESPIVAPKLPTVHLAGPIAGCDKNEGTSWRNQLTSALAGVIQFNDPVVATARIRSSREIVPLDLKLIDDSDLVLANAWKVSAGTSMEMMHCKHIGKPLWIWAENYEHLRGGSTVFSIHPWYEYTAGTANCFSGSSFLIINRLLKWAIAFKR